MQPPLLASVSRFFDLLCQEYGFAITQDEYQGEGFGSGCVRLESERYFIEVTQDGMGPEVKIRAGKKGQPAADLAWVFAYITRSISSVTTGAAPWLYYYPHFSLGIWGDESAAWQIDRLSGILRRLWPDIFLFFDMDGHRSADFLAFQERANRAAAEYTSDGYHLPSALLAGRDALNFAPLVDKSFSFLKAYGFQKVHADPVYVRFESSTDGSKPAVFINIYHLLRSYQIGIQIGKVMRDPQFEQNFDLEELAGWAGVPYQAMTAQTAPELQNALNRMARLFRRCAASVLSGDPRLFDALLARRIDAAHRVSRAWTERSRH